jgi:hypothetical protein
MDNGDLYTDFPRLKRQVQNWQGFAPERQTVYFDLLMEEIFKAFDRIAQNPGLTKDLRELFARFVSRSETLSQEKRLEFARKILPKFLKPVEPAPQAPPAALAPRGESLLDLQGRLAELLDATLQKGERANDPNWIGVWNEFKEDLFGHDNSGKVVVRTRFFTDEHRKEILNALIRRVEGGQTTYGSFREDYLRVLALYWQRQLQTRLSRHVPDTLERIQAWALFKDIVGSLKFPQHEIFRFILQELVIDDSWKDGPGFKAAYLAKIEALAAARQEEAASEDIHVPAEAGRKDPDVVQNVVDQVQAERALELERALQAATRAGVAVSADVQSAADVYKRIGRALEERQNAGRLREIMLAHRINTVPETEKDATKLEGLRHFLTDWEKARRGFTTRELFRLYNRITNIPSINGVLFTREAVENDLIRLEKEGLLARVAGDVSSNGHRPVTRYRLIAGKEKGKSAPSGARLAGPRRVVVVAVETRGRGAEDVSRNLGVIRELAERYHGRDFKVKLIANDPADLGFLGPFGTHQPLSLSIVPGRGLSSREVLETHLDGSALGILLDETGLNARSIAGSFHRAIFEADRAFFKRKLEEAGFRRETVFNLLPEITPYDLSLLEALKSVTPREDFVLTDSETAQVGRGAHHVIITGEALSKEVVPLGLQKKILEVQLGLPKGSLQVTLALTGDPETSSEEALRQLMKKGRVQPGDVTRVIRMSNKGTLDATEAFLFLRGAVGPELSASEVRVIGREELEFNAADPNPVFSEINRDLMALRIRGDAPAAWTLVTAFKRAERGRLVLVEPRPINLDQIRDMLELIASVGRSA